MLPHKEVVYVDHVVPDKKGMLGADIGGTNSNFGIFQLTDHNPKMVLSIHFKSQQVTDFAHLIADVVHYVGKTYNITIAAIAIAAAGVESPHHDYTKPTNLGAALDAKKIIQATGIECVTIVNDFEIIGYGLESLATHDLVLVNMGQAREKANKAIIGAGTGLGKTILIWNEEHQRYTPSASEGGHADFAPQNQQELDFMEYIRASEKWSCNISWEDVLSGNGIKRMYHFFKKIDGAAGYAPQPDDIFKSRIQDSNAQKTFELYTRCYARCAKNFALDALALGGIYIAGGIASKNLPLFQLPIFMSEFTNCGKQQQLLKQIPVYVITDYNVSLYGIANYLVAEGICP
jgi:glucokinase